METVQPTTGLAQEGGHWYRADGSPAYTVKAKAGHDRPVTLADARKLGLLPSVTGIIKLAAAPALEVWKRNQILLAAMTLPRSPEQSEQDWMDAVVRDSQEQGKQAAERGTAIHAALERSYARADAGIEVGFLATVLAVRKAVAEAFGSPAWHPEKSFASQLHGYGCKIDLAAREGAGIVIDFKGSEFEEGTVRKGFDEHCMQLAANRMAANLPEARCANVFFSRSSPGAVCVHEWNQKELARGWAMFRALLDFYYSKTGLER